MKTKMWLWLALAAGVTGGVVVGTNKVRAEALTLGSGYYTNLCGGGTAADVYSCDPGCSPATGVCQSTDDSVVKWICRGKWSQCLEGESGWSKAEQVSPISCGYTVQVSKFDKKCRGADGSWDGSCRLMGYLTWYSGDCSEPAPAVAGVVIGLTPVFTASPSAQLTEPEYDPVSESPIPTLAPGITPKPSAVPTPTYGVTPKPSAVPTPTIKAEATPPEMPGGGACQSDCQWASDCPGGLACIGQICRNPDCRTETDCVCAAEQATATAAAVAEKTPETGWETWAGMAAMAGTGLAGFRIRRLAKRVW